MEITADTLVADIAAANARERPEDRVFTDAPLGTLLDHIVSRYHTALREDLPLLGARLRALSGGFTVPEDGCTTYRALYEGLARFERELHEHVHLENNVLFPRVVSLRIRR